jgi:hypothetical protein
VYPAKEVRSDDGAVEVSADRSGGKGDGVVVSSDWCGERMRRRRAEREGLEAIIGEAAALVVDLHVWNLLYYMNDERHIVFFMTSKIVHVQLVGDRG